MPTGSGKTLCSLQIAMQKLCASEGRLKRIIYVIPFTSIIEQTAAEFASLIGDHVTILQHHSNFSYEDIPEADTAKKMKLAAENYDLYGVTDCIEFLRDDSGVPVPELKGTYQVRVIEYKPRAPKDVPYHETDAIQVFAQKICADFVWHCDSEAYLYYADIRKRVKLPFDTEYARYDELLKRLLNEMRGVLDAHEIPQRKKGQHCSGCSLAERCFPKPQRGTVREQIMAMTEETEL